MRNSKFFGLPLLLYSSRIKRPSHINRKTVSLLTTRGIISSLRSTVTSDHGYVILLPEVPLDTKETNSLLASTELPNFNSLTKIQYRNAMVKLSLELESKVWALEDHLTNKQRKQFEQLLSLEDSSAPFEYVWSIVKTLGVVRNDFIPDDGYKSLHDRGRMARSKRYTSVPIYMACKELITDSGKLTEPQRRLISKYLVEGKLCGLELTGTDKEHLKDINRKLEDFKLRFGINARLATKKFRHLIVDPKYMGDMPAYQLRNLAKDKAQPGKGPWIVTLEPDVYKSFVEYCPERALRWNTWQALNNRAAGDLNKELNNSINIEEIRCKRKEQAKLLGFDTYVDLSMTTKMAGNVDNVKSMIATLLLSANPRQEAELTELAEFAASRGFEKRLALWDIPYWRRKQRKSIFSIDDSTIRDYFPYPVVLKELFAFAESLFSVRFIRIDDPMVAEMAWSPDVSLFKLVDAVTGGEIGSFFIDPYLRPGQKLNIVPGWFFGNRSRCDRLGHKPHATLAFNFEPPLYGKPSLLTFDEVHILFEKFGQLCQHLMTEMSYSEVSGSNNVEWDVVGVPSKFMSSWLRNKDVVSKFAVHHENGAPMPSHMLTDLIDSKNHLAAFDLCHELYLSALDIEFFTSEEFWRDVVKSLWPKYKGSNELDKQDAHPCSFTSILSGNFSAAYYSNIWSSMLAADIYQTFEEHKKHNLLLDPQKERVQNEQELGRRFRSTFLAMGGGHHPAEVFRRFRGRDPTPSALLLTLGLADEPESQSVPLKIEGLSENDDQVELLPKAGQIKK